MIMQALKVQGFKHTTVIFFSCFLQFMLAIILLMSCLSHSSHVLEISESALKTACIFIVLMVEMKAQRYEEGRLL